MIQFLKFIHPKTTNFHINLFMNNKTQNSQLFPIN